MDLVVRSLGMEGKLYLYISNIRDLTKTYRYEVKELFSFTEVYTSDFIVLLKFCIFIYCTVFDIRTSILVEQPF